MHEDFNRPIIWLVWGRHVVISAAGLLCASIRQSAYVAVLPKSVKVQVFSKLLCIIGSTRFHRLLPHLRRLRPAFPLTFQSAVLTRLGVLRPIRSKLLERRRVLTPSQAG